MRWEEKERSSLWVQCLRTVFDPDKLHSQISVRHLTGRTVDLNKWFLLLLLLCEREERRTLTCHVQEITDVFERVT